jgi:Flp pilus assembly protein TadD
LADAQKKAESHPDAASMEALGVAYLESHQVHLAHLALARSTELEDNRATAHSALGLANLLEGDPMSARAEYGKALEADPTLAKARANMAALKCRYGDPQGAKRELSLIKDQGALRAPDVDIGFRSCQ